MHARSALICAVFLLIALTGCGGGSSTSAATSELPHPNAHYSEACLANTRVSRLTSPLPDRQDPKVSTCSYLFRM